MLVALAFLVLAVIRFRVRDLPEGSSEAQVRGRLDVVWWLLMVNATLWGAASAWLLMVANDESARTVVAASTFAFATAFAHNFPMRMRAGLLAIVLIYLPMLAAYVASGARFELVAVSVAYLLYVSLALRRSHIEYVQRIGLEDALREQRDRFEQQSRRDGLTGLANRRRFTAALEDWVQAARTDGPSLALMILDLDEFKSINDRHGHAAGDACLIEFAGQLQREFPGASELAARLGGEEFGVLVRDCTLDEALQRADAVRMRFAESALPVEGHALRSSVSIGVAWIGRGSNLDGDGLYHAADGALYRAKAAGRNMVMAG